MACSPTRSMPTSASAGKGCAGSPARPAPDILMVRRPGTECSQLGPPIAIHRAPIPKSLNAARPAQRSKVKWAAKAAASSTRLMFAHPTSQASVAVQTRSAASQRPQVVDSFERAKTISTCVQGLLGSKAVSVMNSMHWCWLGGSDRTSEWRNQNPLISSCFSSAQPNCPLPFTP